MVKSMTGFGKGESKFASGKVTIEIKTVNHKFFDATLKLPNGIAIFEDKIKEILQRNIKRGKVNFNLIYEGKLFKAESININKKVAKKYFAELTNLQKLLGIKEEIGIKDIVSLPGVLDYNAVEGSFTRFWPQIKSALGRALSSLLSDREKEGKATCLDLAMRSKNITRLLKTIKSRAHLNIGEYREKFADRVKDLTSGRHIDMGRLEMEVAIFAKNSDISEEIVRLTNHLSNFNKTISVSGEVGKKLDFIAQELHREINTIGSKASDFKISKNVIEIKGEIEKIREQAKNLE